MILNGVLVRQSLSTGIRECLRFILRVVKRIASFGRWMLGWAASAIFLTSTHEVLAGSSEPVSQTVDKSQYNLFNPTPPAQMRDFAPDRPNVTDGPYTVDPGHLLLEVGLFEYARDRYNSERIRLDSFAFGDTNLRLGVTTFAELDFLFTAYSYIRTKDKDSGAHLKQSGFSDLTVRSKINFLGDDGGSVAIGLIPFVTFPTGQDGVGNRGFAGGIGLPIQFGLPANFQLGIETTIQTVHEPGGGSHFDYLNSISLGHPISKKLSTYIEFATDVSTASHSDWIGTVDTGLVYQPANNWQLDAGVEIGVTRAANDLFTFIGAAWRY
jgi:Putative MetA-pathway of phenol degradation